jgi:hypothetical protein
VVDAANKITLPGVTVAQLQANPNDFHFFDPSSAVHSLQELAASLPQASQPPRDSEQFRFVPGDLPAK